MVIHKMQVCNCRHLRVKKENTGMTKLIPMAPGDIEVLWNEKISLCKKV